MVQQSRISAGGTIYLWRCRPRHTDRSGYERFRFLSGQGFSNPGIAACGVSSRGFQCPEPSALQLAQCVGHQPLVWNYHDNGTVQSRNPVGGQVLLLTQNASQGLAEGLTSRIEEN